jgi:hypothetical protein
MPGRVVATMAIMVLPGTLAAQVGLSSNLAQVALVAHVAPRASIESVGALVETARIGQVREASATVRFATNTGYRLLVSSDRAETGRRIWVRAAGGEYRELTPGTAVTVARAKRVSGHWVREVNYRIESATDAVSLPVRYEIVVEPTL